MSGSRPPRWLERIVEWARPAGLSAQGTLGDLAEEFERQALESPTRARLWYAAQTASILGYRIFTGSGSEGAGAIASSVAGPMWRFVSPPSETAVGRYARVCSSINSR